MKEYSCKIKENLPPTQKVKQTQEIWKAYYLRPQDANRDEELMTRADGSSDFLRGDLGKVQRRQTYSDTWWGIWGN